MKQLFIPFTAVLMAIYSLSSCNESIQLRSVETSSKVFFSVDKFIDAGSSRTSMDPNNNYIVTWAEDDVIGIYPREGDQEPFAIPESQVGMARAEFDGGYWAVKDGLEYNAYYPFDRGNFVSLDMKTKIPVSYLGQQQIGTECGAGAYDFIYSDWTVASGGLVNFSFHHLGAIAVFSVKYPASTTYTKLTIQVTENAIPVDGTYDLTAENVNLLPVNLSSKLELTLYECSGVAGETGTFYMMLPPMDLSNSDVKLILTAAAGTEAIYALEDCNVIQKGVKYNLVGKPQSSTVSGTIDNWDKVDDEIVGGNDLEINWASDVSSEQKQVLTKLVQNMVSVKAGTFLMGSADAYDNEKPVHTVTLSEYCIGRYEVTQEEWTAVMGVNPSNFSGINLPVECVSWDEIVNNFIPELNRLTGLNFRLPTEAEWEYAARGGDKSKGYMYSGSDDAVNVAWYIDNSTNITHEVGTKLANELGLYDMSGNVCEWCNDCYNPTYYARSPIENPTGPTPSKYSDRVIRGGGYDPKFNIDFCRITGRGSYWPTSTYSAIGFRLAH